VEVVEILDLYHVYEYLWLVGNTVFGASSTAAAAWVEPLKTRLYAQGPAPVQEALATLAATVGARDDAEEGESAAGEVVRRACAYFAEHAARLDYPAFVARALPIGSGAVESAGKTVVKARTNGAGMRWRQAGAQHVVSLRTLHHSGRWEVFWASAPPGALLHLAPRQPRTPSVTRTPTRIRALPAPDAPPIVCAAPIAPERPLVSPVRRPTRGDNRRGYAPALPNRLPSLFPGAPPVR